MLQHPEVSETVFDLIIADPPYSDMMSKERTGQRKKLYNDSSPMPYTEEGYDGLTINKHTEIWKARNAKDPKYGYGVLISKTWYWYESWAKEIEKYCKTHSDEVK